MTYYRQTRQLVGRYAQPSYQECVDGSQTLDELMEVLNRIESDAADYGVDTSEMANLEDLPKFGGEPVEDAQSWDADRVLEWGKRDGYVATWFTVPRSEYEP